MWSDFIFTLDKISFKIYNSVKDLPALWDTVAQSNIFLQTPYLTVLEESAPVNMECFYIGIFENSELIGVSLAQYLDLNKLEETVAKHPMIAKSDVYVTVDGVLRANVYQKTPVARVFSEESSFYIDSTGSKMPLSQNYTARVPLLYGKIKKEYAKPITKVLNCIEKDQFLKQNIIGVVVNPNQSLILRNRNFDYEIVFGGPIYIEKKFKNYKAFFQKAVEDSVLYHYKKVDLRFLKQVVCTK